MARETQDMYGYLVPQNYAQAVKIDEDNGNTKWQDCTMLEVLAISSYVQEHQWLLLLLFGAIFTQDAHLILVQQQVAISS